MSRFITILIILISSQLYSQPTEIPLFSNPKLYLKQNRTARNDGLPQLKVYVPLGEQVVFCPGNLLISGEIDSIIYTECQELMVGSVELGDSCATYTNNGASGEDIICLEICALDGVCTNFEVVFIAAGSVDVPFSEDFSYDGPYPQSELWLTNDVYINYTLASNPYSLGVATFDGLDATGAPYPEGSRYSDELTSKFMDVRSVSDPTFSFYVQPKGNGIKPRVMDSLSLDFRDEKGRWIRVWQQEGLGNDFPISDPAPDFAYRGIALADSFIHEFFQFRFRNKSKNEGLQELWHLDYVRVGDPEETAEIFEDIAFTALPKSVLAPYSHMPSNHFTADEVRSNVISALYNFDATSLSMADPTITVIHDGQTLMSRTFIEPVQNWSLSPGHTDYDFSLNDGNSMNYEILQAALVDLIEPEETYRIQTRLDFSRSSEIIHGDQNNEVEEVTIFSNFFAYDDGTAESAIIDRGGPGVRSTTLAVEYHTNVDDQLQGVQFHFPHIEGDVSSQLFNLKIWIDSLDDEPEFIQELVKPYYADAFYDTLQGYTTYDLRDTGDNKIALEIPKGRFFVGWEQVDISSVKIPVGYDINSPNGSQFFYFNAGGGWVNVGQSGTVRPGALMVRPVLGDTEVIPTPINEPEEHSFNIYPNPTTGYIFLDYDVDYQVDWEIQVYDILGKRVHVGPLKRELDLTHLTAGVYLLSTRNLKFDQVFTTKLILTD